MELINDADERLIRSGDHAYMLQFKIPYNQKILNESIYENFEN